MLTLSRWKQLPASSVVAEILYDTAGTNKIDTLLDGFPDPILTLDYQLAGYVNYLTPRNAYSGWGQFRIWELPSFERATIMSLGYLPDGCISDVLNETFYEVSEVTVRSLVDADVTKNLHLWIVDDPSFPPNRILERLDFLTLWELCR
jgi:hypothetical protein